MTFPEGLSTRRLPRMQSAERTVSSNAPSVLINLRSLTVYFDAAQLEIEPAQGDQRLAGELWPASETTSPR